jgi:hypothetical protein
MDDTIKANMEMYKEMLKKRIVNGFSYESYLKFIIVLRYC